MKILALTDIHSRVYYTQQVTNQLQQADLVLIAGDITNFGDREEANLIIEKLLLLNRNILAIPGNCDHVGVLDTLVARNMNLHAATKITGNTMFFGIGGCNKTPFHTPQEYSEQEIAGLLGNFAKTPDVDRFIFISHAPPYKTKLDRVILGFHVGSKAIRNFIEDFKPDVVVCGHIHEARGYDYIGEALIINPGPFPKHYGLIQINGKIEFELY